MNTKTPAADSVDYEVVSRDTVEQMHQKFMNDLETKARKAVPADMEDPGPVVEFLKALLIASTRKAVEIKPDQLAELAQAGKEAIEARTKEIETKVHSRSPFASSYPSPTLGTSKEQQVAKAAKKRKDDQSVKNIFGEEERIYLQMKGAENSVISDTQKRIAQYLGGRYTISDYSKGYATDERGKQQFRIGKLLKDHEPLYKAFMDDSTRTLSSLYVVISRNANDIATMSTGRAWSSCMGSGGFNWKYVPRDVQKGSVIAYMVSEKDPDIVNPLARILIKPFNKKDGKLSSAARRAFRRQKGPQHIFLADKTYGIHNDAFTATVGKFIEENLNSGKDGKFKLANGLYQDGVPYAQVRKDGKITKTDRSHHGGW